MNHFHERSFRVNVRKRKEESYFIPSRGRRSTAGMARFRAVRARMTGEPRRRNANTGEQCTPWLYTHTHTSVGGRLKWVAGQTGWSIGGELEHQSSSVDRVANTGRDRNLFVYHSFDLRGDEVNEPTNTRSCILDRE